MRMGHKKQDTDQNHTHEKELKKRLMELAEQSRLQNVYYFTDFLSPSDAAIAYEVAQARDFSVWGGAQDCDRMMIRFGNAEAFGYEVDYPITCLSIRPLQDKFSDALTHRDYLGALMNLGIERDTMGDLIVKENHAWLFVEEHMAPLITRELTRVKHTTVMCEVIEALPAEAAYSFEEMTLIVPSVRMDVIAAKLCHLSREKAKALFPAGKVLINGRNCDSVKAVPKENEILVLRGYGKFIYRGIERTTAKDNCVIRVDRYL